MRHLSTGHLSLLAAVLILSAIAGCSSQPKTRAEVVEDQTKDQQKAIRIAKDYLSDHGGVAKNDAFSATPYNGGWMVRVDRVTGESQYGRTIDFGATRFVKIGPDGHVLEGFNGAGVD
jgi:hypothetical protein